MKLHSSGPYFRIILRLFFRNWHFHLDCLIVDHVGVIVVDLFTILICIKFCKAFIQEGPVRIPGSQDQRQVMTGGHGIDRGKHVERYSQTARPS